MSAGNSLAPTIIIEGEMARVTSRGQVTIPEPVRDLLGVGPGGEVDFRRAADGSIVLVRADTPSRFARLRGHAGPGLSTDAILALTRGDAPKP